ncbi:MAG: 2-hydroxyacyl-CoA dehydratase family protein [Desulfosalsimonadaceae bacterium]
MMNSHDEILEKFQTVSESPHVYAASAKEQTGKKILGFFCSYAPEELIQAAGAIPFRLFGAARDIELADSHLQSYCCSLVRGGLEDALRGRLDFLDGTVFPHTCDSIQRLSDIWRLNAGFGIHIDAVMPVKLHTPSARQYMVDVLAGVRSDLEKALGIRISDSDVSQSIRLYNGIRSKLLALYQLRSANPGIVPQSAVYHTMKAAMVMDREELAKDLEILLPSLEKVSAETGGSGRKRILLAGGICNHPDIYKIIDKAGGDVVWDDLCTGVRYATGLIEESGAPIEAIAERYMHRLVCPAKHMSTTARGENLVAEAIGKKIDGVVFLHLKFCDPHAFDYPYLKEYLAGKNVPSMLLEIEEQPPAEEQLRTRFETFIDML